MANNKKSKVSPRKKKQPSKWAPVWAQIRFFFGTLFNNQNCFEARKKPWWVGLIMALASCVIAVTPIMSANFSQDAGSVLATPSYNLDNALADFNEELFANDVEINVADKALQSVNNWDAIATNTTSEGYKYYAHAYEKRVVKTITTTDENDSSITTTVVKDQVITVTDLIVYYNSYGLSLETFFSEVVDLAHDPNYPYNQTLTAYSVSTIIIDPEGLYLYKMANGATASGVLGLWDASEFQNKNIVDVLEEKCTGTTAIAGWQSIIRLAWDSTRIADGWKYVGIAFGIDVGMCFIYGAVLFLITRGKSNPFRQYNFLDYQKTAWWAAITPGLLSLVGFLGSIASSSLGMLIFVLLYGVRIMWLAMKTLRPQYE